MRKICYVTGTRADFGLMTQTLRLLNADPNIDLSICVTGMHLSITYGLTVREIESENFRICARLVVDLEKMTEANMAAAIGHEIAGLVEVFEQEKPDIVLLLGDRGETLAAAIAAIHLNITVVHIHGGERSGTIDESVRHAISKLSHYHFAATEQSRERLIKMGEVPEHIFVTGAPGLDGIHDDVKISREALCSEQGFDAKRPIGLMVFHPVVQEIGYLQDQFRRTLETALEQAQLQLVCYTPNSDAGGKEIRGVLEEYSHHSLLRIVTHLTRASYLAWLASVDVMLGNSSSAIIEAASFGLTVINIGTRQNVRERSANVIDVAPTSTEIMAAIQTVLNKGKTQYQNIYGDGKASERILDLLQKLSLDRRILFKCNSY